ncbi:MAG: hypothetical protein ACRDHG_01290, partial [Anaerolineales bacterium]
FYDEGLARERDERRAAWMESFLSGTYMGEYYGLPELVAQRQAVLSGGNPAEVQAAYIDRLGALGLEAQMDNIIGQVVVDPLWFFSLTPIVEGAQALRSVAVTSRVAPEIVGRIDDVVRLANNVDELAGFGRLDDLVEATGELRRVAEAVGVDEITRVANELDDLARAVPGEAPAARELLLKLDELKPILDTAQELRPMSRVERIAVAVTGGDPFHPPKFWARGVLGRINPLALSASARADELINMIHNNLSPLLREAGSYEEMIRVIKQGAGGAFGRRLGHMFISPMGRYTQRVLKEVSRNVDELGQTLIATQRDRDLLEILARVTGQDVVTVAQRAMKSEEEARALFSQFRGALATFQDGAGVEVLRRMVAAGELTADQVFGMGQILRPTKDKIVPFTEDLMRAAIMKHAVDAAVEMGIREFGVKRATMLQQAAQYVKSAESLVFLGLNPFYPVQNFYNGEVTSFLRGSWSLMLPERYVPKPLRGIVPTIEDVWRRAKVEPARLHEGFGVAGPEYWDELAKSTTAAEQAALIEGRKAVRQTVWPTPKGIGGWFMEKTRAVKAFKGPANATERMQSERLVTTGYTRAMRKLKRAYSKLDDVVPGFSEELRTFDGRLADYLEDAVRAAQNSDEILDVARSKNLAVNLETLLRRTAEAMGFDVERMTRFVDEEVHESVRRTLEALPARASEEATRNSFRQIEDFVQLYLDEMIEANLPTMLSEAQAKVSTEGSSAVVQLLGELSERTYARHAANMRYFDTAVDGVLRIEDPVLRNRSWKSIKETARLAWSRHWNSEEAVRRGIEAGLRDRGVAIPDAFVDSFSRLRQGSQSYILRRDQLWDGYFTALTEGRFEGPLDALEGAAKIYEELDRRYIHLIELSDASRRQMDAIFNLVMPEGFSQELRTGVRSWRELVARNVKLDMERVLDFHQSVRGLEPQVKHVRWREFDEARMLDHQRILELEQLGRAMVNGDARAAEFFVQQADALGLRPGAGDLANTIFEARRASARVSEPDLALLERSLGEPISPEDQAGVDRLLRRFVTEAEREALDTALQRAEIASSIIEGRGGAPVRGRRLIEGAWWRPAAEGEVFEPGREFRLQMGPEPIPEAGGGR